MWMLITDWEDICSMPLDDCTGHVLEFSDGCMLLASANVESFGELEQKSIDLLLDTGRVYLDSEPQFPQSN
jgi:hypothetical protein